MTSKNKYVKVKKEGRCKAITLKGKKCNKPAFLSGYCTQHHFVVWEKQNGNNKNDK